MTDEKRKECLARNKWIRWADSGATFTFADYVAHVGRMKTLRAFDDLNMRQPEPILLGSRTTDARHFTNFSLRQTSGNRRAEIDSDLRILVNMMNVMHFIGQNNNGCAKYPWRRQGTSGNHPSQTVIVNLATSLENRNKDYFLSSAWSSSRKTSRNMASKNE